MLVTMRQMDRILLLLTALLTQSPVHATRLSDKEYQVFTNRERREPRQVSRRQYSSDDDTYSNVFGAIWDSDQGNLVQAIASIPCSDIQSIASDPDQVSSFVSSIATGDVPSFISSHLPDTAATEFALAFSDVISIASDGFEVDFGGYSEDVMSAFDDIATGYTESASSSIATADIDLATSRYDDLYNGGSTFWGTFGCPSDGCPTTSYCSIPTATGTYDYYDSAETSSGAYDYYDSAATSSGTDEYDSSETNSAYSAALSSYSSVLSQYYSTYDSSVSDESVYEKFTSSVHATAGSSQPKVTQTNTATRQQTTSQGANRGNGVQSTASATPTPSTQAANKADGGWGMSSLLVVAASGIFGLALWL